MQATPLDHGDEDDDEAWLRRLALPEEYIIAHFQPPARNGYYRWFQSPNVIDLVRIRRQQAKQAARTNATRLS
jgi:hypothetical protein